MLVLRLRSLRSIALCAVSISLFSVAYLGNANAKDDAPAKQTGTGESEEGDWVDINSINDPGKLYMNDETKKILAGVFEACKDVLEKHGCTKFRNMGTSRDRNVKPPGGAQNSCHYNAPPEAIDIGAFGCKDAEVKPEQGEHPFSAYRDIATCFATTKNVRASQSTNTSFKILYGFPVAPEGYQFHHEPGHHKDHMHFEIPGCKSRSPGAK